MDLLDDVDDMMGHLVYVYECIPLYDHSKIRSSNLDFRLFALVNDQDVEHLGTYVSKHKLT